MKLCARGGGGVGVSRGGGGGFEPAARRGRGWAPREARAGRRRDGTGDAHGVVGRGQSDAAAGNFPGMEEKKRFEERAVPSRDANAPVLMRIFS